MNDFKDLMKQGLPVAMNEIGAMELPDDQTIADNIVRDMLSVTSYLMAMTSLDGSNINIAKELSAHLPRTLKLVQDRALFRNGGQLAAAAPQGNFTDAFSLEPTNYQAVACDAFGVPLASANDSLEGDLLQ